MKNRFTFLMAFCLLSFTTSAQLVDVITNVSLPWSLELDGNDLYIGLDGAGEIIKIDKTQQNPVPTSVLTGLGYLGQGGLWLDGDDLYIGYYNSHKVVKMDLSQPNPTPVDVLTVNDPYSLLKSGNYLYVGTDNEGIKKFDLTNPSNVVTYSPSSSVGGMALKGNVLYYSNVIEGNVYKIDESLPNPTPTLVASGYWNPYGLTLNGNFLYVAEDTKVTKIDLGQSMPQPETVVSGLGGSRLTAFDGLDMYISQYALNKVSKLTINQPAFSSLGTVCTNEDLSTLGGASPTGGTYSGPGVTDNGDGETFTFNPAATGGPGTYTITYTAINGNTVTSTLTVAAAPVVTAPDNAEIKIDAGVIALEDGVPAGGTWSGPGVLPGDIFDPMLAGIGVHTLTYTYTNASGCSGSATFQLTVTSSLPGNSVCDAFDINGVLGGAQNVSLVTNSFNNSSYSTIGDPAEGIDCFYGGDGLQHTIWYTFTGDGNTYRIRTVSCGEPAPLDDSQVAIYSGDCSNLTPAGCNEDEDPDNNVFNVSIDFPTQQGVTYYMLIDGYGGTTGAFCLEVTNLSATAVTEISSTDIEIFPNPTAGVVNLTNVNADLVQVFDSMGRLIRSEVTPGYTLNISGMPAGVYFLKITEGEQVYSARVVKE